MLQIYINIWSLPFSGIFSNIFIGVLGSKNNYKQRNTLDF